MYASTIRMISTGKVASPVALGFAVLYTLLSRTGLFLATDLLAVLCVELFERLELALGGMTLGYKVGVCDNARVTLPCLSDTVMSADLPTEILLHIIEGGLEKGTLYSMGLANKRFNELCTPFIYRDVHLALGTSLKPIADPDDREKARFFAFASALDAKPLLGSLVHYLKVASPHFVRNEDLHTAMVAIIHRVPDIRSLSIPDGLLPETTTSDWTEEFLRWNPFTSLTRLHLGIRVQISKMAPFFFLPAIEDLSFGWCYRSDGAEGFWNEVVTLPKGRSDRSSPVKRLSLGTGWEPSTLFAPFLLWPSRLEGFSAREIVIGSYAPRATLNILSPFRTTLTELDLLALLDDFSMSDGSYMDLSSFTVLQKLKITSCLLVPFDGTPDEGFYRLLPQSLEDFEVSLLN